MKAKQRWDSFQVKATIDANGFLSDTPIVARTGLQVYTLPDGTQRREFRPASEVFDPDSMATFQGKPLTIGHIEVNSDNAKEVTVGSTTGRAFRTWDGDDYSQTLQCPVVVFDKTAVSQAVSKAMAEISVGYTSIDIDKPGWGNELTGEYFFEDEEETALDVKMDEMEKSSDGWVKFDAVQTTIRVNHLALVFRGRAGVAKLNLDAEQEFPYDTQETFKPKEDSLMTVKIKFDGETEHEVPEAVANHINALNAKIQSAEASNKAKTDELEAQRDQLKVKVDSLPTLIAEATAKAKADADEMAAVVAVAAAAGIKTDGLTPKEIKVAYIKSVSGIDAANKEDAYINSAFDFARDSDKMASQRLAISGKTDSAEQESGIPDPQMRFRNRAAKK